MSSLGTVRLCVLTAFLAAALQAQRNPVITGVVNAASQDGRLSPLCMVDVLGTDLGTDKTVGAFVGGRQAKIVSAGSSRWRIVIPGTVTPGASTVEIGISAPFNITVAQFAPALFSVDGTGKGVVSAIGYRLSSTGGLILPGYPLSAASPAKLGDVLVLNATGLGLVDASNYDEPYDTPAVTLAGKPTPVMFAPLITDTTDPDNCTGSCTPWFYEVMIALPPALATGDQQVSISVNGVASQTLDIPINSTPLVNAVVNGASFSSKAPLVPGELASVFGTTFGANDVIGVSSWPTEAQGVSVTFNGTKAPLVALVASAGQINLQVPTEAPISGNATVKVTTPDGVSADFSVAMASSAPGVFFIPSTLQGRPHNAAALFNATAWRVMPSDLAAEWGMSTNCKASGISAATLCGEPAQRGDYIQIYVTGLGRAAANGDVSQGVLGTNQTAPENGNPLYKALEQPTVTVGGVPVTPGFAGVAPGYAGLYQINLQIPASAPTGDYVPVSVIMPSGAKDDTTTIAIKP
jgi:uncharacterized protein (TIGR03437 family)